MMHMVHVMHMVCVWREPEQRMREDRDIKKKRQRDIKK